MTFKEKLRCVSFVIKMCRNRSKKILLLMVLRSLFCAVLPLIPAYFSSVIIDGLTQGGNLKALIKNIVLCAVLSGVFYFGSVVFKKLFLEEANILKDYESKTFEEQISSMDYELLEDADFQKNVKAYRVVYENNGGAVYGFWFFTGNFLEGVFSLLLSLVLIYPLIGKIISSAGKTGFLPIAVLCIFVLCIALILILVGNRYTKINNKVYRVFNEIFASFKYWFYFPSDYRKGKEIRIYSAQKLVESKHEEYMKKWEGINKKNTDIKIKYDSFIGVLQVLILGAFYLFTGLQAKWGAFSVGSFALFIGVSARLAEGIALITAITFVLGVVSDNIGYYKRVVETPRRKFKGTLPVEKRDDNRFEIEFKNVSFKYPGSDEYALKNLSVKLNIGKHFAVVGRNGSGKTTFIKLLCRLYDVDEGEITLNGINIKKYDLKEYMSLFSVVFQDFKLFSVPLSQNVTTSLEYDEEKLFRCLDKAGILGRVEEMPLKENSVLYKDFDDRGIEISGGEAQKLALARALYKDAPFVILDEPTAALDPVSEFEIYKRFNSLVEDKTAVYISHRLSSCRFCNEIYVFDGGRLVQNGSHKELVNAQGKYRELWTAQSVYYNDE